MSWQATSWALKQRVGDPVLKILLLSAANYADPDGRCWPKVETLAFDSEVSKRTIQRRLVELQEMGLIRVTARYDSGGKQISSMIEFLMEEGCQSGTVGVTPSCHGEGDNKVSPPDSLNDHKNKHKRSDINRIEYPEEFELKIWQPYPRKAGTSKKKAYDQWRMLTPENQARVAAAIPIFAEQMRREGRPEDKIKHLQFFLSERIWETVSGSPASPRHGGAWDPKTATREQWERILQIWRMDNNWRLAWGPAPDKPGCHVPIDMLTDAERGIFERSKPDVDKRGAA